MAVGDQAVRGALSTLSGLICAIVNSIRSDKEILQLGKSQGKIREFQKPLDVATLSKFLSGQLCCFVCIQLVMT